jgi:hypothetical protein
MTGSGDGTLSLWKYQYPDQRKIKVCWPCSLGWGSCASLPALCLLDPQLHACCSGMGPVAFFASASSMLCRLAAGQCSSGYDMAATYMSA